MQELSELQRQGMSIQAISELTGWDRKTLLRMHEEACRQLGGVPEEILYDRMKTVWLRSDERGEIVWHPVLLDLARYWGFTSRLCRPIVRRPRARWNRA